MIKDIHGVRQEFSDKVERLEAARKVLKQEFIGVDLAIDEIINNVRAWYTMWTIQERPMVVNLWGLTGVGKTSLIHRLSQLISFERKTVRFDMGEKSSIFSFYSKFKDLCMNKDNEPLIIILDEFQHARTIKNPMTREEVEDDKSRMVWELIDSGKIEDSSWISGLLNFQEFVQQLHFLIEVGITAEKGKIVKGWEVFKKELDHVLDKEDEKSKQLVPRDFYDFVLSHIAKEHNVKLKTELEEKFASLNELETLDLLIETQMIARAPRAKYFTKAIIFVVGNMDEAYGINSNQSADISADDFYEISKNINLPKIKHALRSRFRDEQIARLGNMHVIYPSLTKKSYQLIINNQLTKLSDSIAERYGIRLEYDESIKAKIYSEGVFPTQGVRPLLTTIDHLIKSKVSLIFHKLLAENVQANRTVLSFTDNKLICSCFYESSAVFEWDIPIVSLVDNLRESRRDELQSITAVHESGHAVLSVVLLNKMPEYILSVTSDADSEGFVFARENKKYFTKNELISRVAFCLGGLAAEELIFGEDHITTGNGDDLERAYRMVDEAYKTNGFGSKPLYYARTATSEISAFHEVKSVEDEMMAVIIKGKQLALKALQEEKDLLLHTAVYLSEHSKIIKKQFQQLVNLHAKCDYKKIMPNDFYRETLKTQFSKIANEIVNQDSAIISSYPVCVNKNKSRND